jgi:hypothetical protein
MDYRAFLKPSDPVVLPYFGGARVDAKDRRYRVEANSDLAPGWWRFRIDGRRAVPIEPASPVELGALPVMRGHWALGYVVANHRELGRIALPPDDEPMALAKVTARRWYSGEWLFETCDFEDEAELSARQALEDMRPIGVLRGVAPSLRAAFAYSFGMAVAAELDVAVTVRELSSRVVTIADGGRAAVQGMFDELVAERRREAERVAARLAALETERRYEQLAGAAHNAKLVTRARDPRARCEQALEGANARLVNVRQIERHTRLEVTYVVDGERIISMVDAQSLQVIDAGVCLSGADRVLTLDAMPSVIREAIEVDHLNITRR